jgi:Flp pilus assembly protein TadG
MFSRLLSLAALTHAAAFLLPAQTQIGPFVPGNYTILRETRLTATLYEYEARLTIANQGAINALNVIGATNSSHANVTIQTSTGTVTLSASMPAYQTSVRDFNLNPSGFYAWASGNIRVGQDASVGIHSAVLMPGTFARITEQPVRAGVSYTINLQSSNPTVTNGTPLPSFTFNSTTGYSVGFSPVRGNAVGATVLSPIQPAGHVQTPTYTYVLTVNP